jgi:hypothetical protein
MATTGTMTFCANTLSHGANLQAYALQQVLRTMGHDNEIIHYRSPMDVLAARRSPFWLARHRTWKTISHLLPVARERARRTEGFRAGHLLFSQTRYLNESMLWESPPEYDAYITGSDQVWNPAYNRMAAAASPWFLGFAPSGRRRISYAASFGVSRLTREEEPRYRSWLNGLDHLSTREFEGQEIIRRLTGREADLLLDPTLLLTAEAWSHIAAPFAASSPYILCYYMPGLENVTRTIAAMARRLSAMTGWDVVNVGLKDYWILNPFVRGIFDAGPETLLGLIQNASFVLTNSFHGTAFSIIFRKPFAVPLDMRLPPEKSLTSRITTLLSVLGLGDRTVIAGRAGPCDALLDINYQHADAALRQETQRARNFLHTALT